MPNAKNEPKSLNSLMKHLRASGINITGSVQKRRLKNMGYYHGYKGYRFHYRGRSGNEMLPITDYSQVIALYDLDMQIKTLLYPKIMLVETTLKNYTLESTLKDAALRCGYNHIKQRWTGLGLHLEEARCVGLPLLFISAFIDPSPTTRIESLREFYFRR